MTEARAFFMMACTESVSWPRPRSFAWAVSIFRARSMPPFVASPPTSAPSPASAPAPTLRAVLSWEPIFNPSFPDSASMMSNCFFTDGAILSAVAMIET